MKAKSAAKATKKPRKPLAGKRVPGVVCVGVSAGDHDSVTRLLGALAADTGMAFVLVQHPDAEQLPAGAAKMPVQEASQGMQPEANHVYVVPAGAEVTMQGDRLQIAERSAAAVDHFFSSLAEARGSEAIGVILSGTGCDGAAGVKALRQAGGITFAQDPESANCGEMPRNAIASGHVDLVRTPECIAAELARIGRPPFIDMLRRDEVLYSEAPEEEWSQLFRTLRRARGVDFSLYRQSGIRRRLARRMAVCNAGSLAAYLKILEIDPAERDVLFAEFSIRATEFFPDPEVFATLRNRVLPGILAEKSEGDAVRVWVPGCFTGEEAYSAAIVLRECLNDGIAGGFPDTPIQIFGTDINDEALDKARAGIYSASNVEGVSPQRLSRYFTAINGSFQVSQQIREACLFVRHDLTRDPPFSKVDLIVCRNVLGCVEPAVQKKILASLHWALRPNGVLLLGRTERLNSGLFTATDPKTRLFRKGLGTYVSPGMTPAEQRESMAWAVIDAAAEAILTIDTGGRIVLANTAAETMFGHAHDGLLGQPLKSLIPEDVPAESSPMGIGLEQTGLRGDGSEFPIEVTVSSLERGGRTLAAVFVKDMTNRQTAEDAANRLSAEVNALRRLRDTAERLWESHDLRDGLEKMIDAGRVLLGADLGNIQLLNLDKRVLEIVAQRGFGPEFLEQYREVSAADATACGRCLRNKQRIVIEDVNTDPEFAPHRAAAAAAGYRAVVSTPLIGTDGKVLGVFSTHFRDPHRPGEEELARISLYAEQASQFIERIRAEEQMQGLSRKLMETQETGNREVARELHDVFSQELAAVCIQLSSVTERLKNDPETTERITEITERIGRLSTDIHRTSRQLHPSILEDLGLEPALRQECYAFQQRTLIRTEFSAVRLPAKIPQDTALCLYRVVQESLRNVHKHSTSSAVAVRIDGGTDGIALRVEDSGGGFDLDAALRKGGLGLVSMEERVRLVNGKLTIESAPGKGTTVTALVPLERK